MEERRGRETMRICSAAGKGGERIGREGRRREKERRE